MPRCGEKKQEYKKAETRKDQARAPAGEGIEHGPKRIEDREEFGHWEMDTVYSKKDSTNEAFLIPAERKTRRGIIILIPNRKAETTAKALDTLERKIGVVDFKRIFRMITVDNGSEFSTVEEMERGAVDKTIPRVKAYFCHSYSSWERGSNENASIMIRWKHPKGADFEKVSARQIAETEQWINNYLRKMPGYIDSEAASRAHLREIGLSA